MRRPHRYCLTRQQIKMSWNPRNNYNIIQRKPLNERHLNIFQLEWKSKALCRLYFNGDVTERIFKNTFNASNRSLFNTFSTMEKRVDNTIFRCMFASSVYAARKMASTGQILVNGKEISRPGHVLQVGDVIQVRPACANETYKIATHPMIRLWSFIPQYLDVNFPTLSAVLLKEPAFDEIPNPYPRRMIENTAAFYSKRG